MLLPMGMPLGHYRLISPRSMTLVRVLTSPSLKLLWSQPSSLRSILLCWLTHLVSLPGIIAGIPLSICGSGVITGIIIGLGHLAVYQYMCWSFPLATWVHYFVSFTAHALLCSHVAPSAMLHLSPRPHMHGQVEGTASHRPIPCHQLEFSLPLKFWCTWSPPPTARIAGVLLHLDLSQYAYASYCSHSTSIRLVVCSCLLWVTILRRQHIAGGAPPFAVSMMWFTWALMWFTCPANSASSDASRPAFHPHLAQNKYVRALHVAR